LKLDHRPCGCLRAAGPEAGPVGIQLLAAPLDEVTALRAGHAFQRATD
jgi:Asp-tRNA(Asn)/Glu-tRNA(Gln) amidotransferase A subunit family amidase